MTCRLAGIKQGRSNQMARRITGMGRSITTGFAVVGVVMIFSGVTTLALDVSKIKDEPDQQIVYKTVGDVELKLHVFLPPDYEKTDSRPAIVFFFGGGWKGGTPKQFYPHSAYFASRGMVAMSAEYRVSGKHKTTPAECVKDGKSAMRYVRAHAKELGIDPERIVAGGGSAGGHVAAAAATVDGFNQEGEDTSVTPVPAALVLFNPVFNNGPGGYGHARVKDYWKAISPRHNLDQTTPPTVVFFGDKDHLVPPEQAKDYQQAMADLGTRCDLYLFEGQKHGFFNYANQKAFIATTMQADRFLASLGLLEGEPTLEKPQDESTTR